MAPRPVYEPISTPWEATAWARQTLAPTAGGNKRANRGLTRLDNAYTRTPSDQTRRMTISIRVDPRSFKHRGDA